MSPEFVAILALGVSVVAFLRALVDHFAQHAKLQKFQHRIFDLERMLRQRSTLANEVAHEIKNPLTAILCSAETMDLLIGEKLDPDHRQSLRYIREYGDQILTLVSDFLDVSRAEGGHLDARPTKVDVKNVVQSIVGLLQTNAMRKRINVRLLCVDEQLDAFVDPKHLKQVLFNLIHNAIKFTQEGGEIQVLVRTEFPKPSISFSVSDNGPGIVEEDLPFVFDPYARAEHSAFSGEPGAGLGLALAKVLVERSGGSIYVESVPGQGTHFEFSVPIWQEVAGRTAPPTTTEKAPAVGQPLKGQQFLVVDEDSGSREAIARLIEAWGGMVDRVALAKDAVRAVTDKTYDAVMIDDTRDGVYGAELARLIRDEVRSAETTIILTSRSPVGEEAVKLAQADQVLQKPLNGKVLLTSLLASGKCSVEH